MYMMQWIYVKQPTKTIDIMFNSIIHIDMKTKLSPYTIASNCTDLIDIRDGINEIQNEMKNIIFLLISQMHFLFHPCI